MAEWSPDNFPRKVLPITTAFQLSVEIFHLSHDLINFPTPAATRTYA